MSNNKYFSKSRYPLDLTKKFSRDLQYEDEGYQYGGRLKKRISNEYPALENVYGDNLENLKIERDKNFRGIEYYDKDLPSNSDAYPMHPNPGSYGIRYNPKIIRKGSNKFEAVAGDLLHGMHQDENYQKLYNDFKEAALKTHASNIDYWWNKQEDKRDGKDAFIQNEIDAKIRQLIQPHDKEHQIFMSEMSPEMTEKGNKILEYLKLNKMQHGGNILPYNTFSEYDKMYPEGGQVKPAPKPQLNPTDEYSKKYPPIYLTDKNDPRIGMYEEAGNQYLYKEPERKKESIVQLDRKGLAPIPTNSPISNIQLKPGTPVQERPKGNFLITTQDKPLRFQRKEDYDEVLEILKAQGLTPKSKSELANGQEASANFAGTFETMMKWLEGKYEGTPSYEYGGNISGYNMNKYIADLGYPNNIPDSPYGQYNNWELSNYEDLMNNPTSQAGNALGKEGVDSLSQAGESAGGAGGAMGGISSYAGLSEALGTGINKMAYSSKGEKDPRDQGWQQTKAAVAKSNPYAQLFYGIDEGLQGFGKMAGGTKGQRAVQFFTDPIGFIVNRGALYKEGEEKRMKEVNEFNAKYNNGNNYDIQEGNYLAQDGFNFTSATNFDYQNVFSDISKGLKTNSAKNPNSLSNIKGLEAAGEVPKGTTAASKANIAGAVTGAIGSVSGIVGGMTKDDSVAGGGFKKAAQYQQATAPITGALYQSGNPYAMAAGAAIDAGALISGFTVGAVQQKNENIDVNRMKDINKFNAKYNNQNYNKLSGGNFLAKYGITTKDDTSSLEQEIFQDFDMFLTQGQIGRQSSNIKKKANDGINVDDPNKVYSSVPLEPTDLIGKRTRVTDFVEEYKKLDPIRKEKLADKHRGILWRRGEEEIENDPVNQQYNYVAKKLLETLPKGLGQKKQLAKYDSLTPRERQIINESMYANKFKKAEAYNANRELGEIAKKPLNEQISSESYREMAELYNKNGRLPFLPSVINPSPILGLGASALAAGIEGNYGEAALNSGMIMGLGYMGGGAYNTLSPIGGIEKNIGEYLTTQTPLRNAYKYNPWAFKPNRNSFYRQIDNETFNEGLESGIIQGKQNINQTKGENIINLNKAFGEDAYYNKGSLYYKNNKDLPYLYEANLGEEAFIPKVNGRTRKYNTENTSVRVSKTPLSIDNPNINLYKKDWLKGYRQIDVPKPAFKSEIDWARWNKEIPENKSLMQEYNAIEQQAKANGTWMKNPDGSEFKGTPEQFVQQNSKNFKKAFPEGFNEVWRGVSKHNKELVPNRSMFTANESLGRSYSNNRDRLLTYDDPEVYAGVHQLVHPKSKNSLTFDGNNAIWNEISLMSPEVTKERLIRNIEFQTKNLEKAKKEFNELIQNPDGSWSSPDFRHTISDYLYKKGLKDREEFLEITKERLKNIENLTDNPKTLEEMRKVLGDKASTDDIAKYIENNNLDYVKIKSINDGDFGNVSIVNHKKGNYLKSLVGNNGMFDMTNPNIYKSLAPLLGIGVLTSQQNKNIKQKSQGMKKGGVVKINKYQDLEKEIFSDFDNFLMQKK